MKLLFFLLVFFPTHSCSATCPLALASYFISPNQTLTFIASLFNIESGQITTRILPFNKQITSQDVIIAGTRVNIPFSCDQFTNNPFLSHSFPYTTTSGDTYNSIARSKYANLTTAESLAVVNRYPPTGIPTGARLNVSVNCSCGNEDVSRDYGLFLTYPVRSGDDISSVAKNTNFTNLELLRKYNPGSDFKSGIVFVPAKGELLMAKRKSIYWTPCAAHCIDLILEDIGKIRKVGNTVKRGVSLSGFIYNHSGVLSMMRKFNGNKELVRFGITRFATSFLCLQSVYKQKNYLRAMFTSEEWSGSRWAREAKGKKARDTVLMSSFWNNVSYTLKVMGPLVRVLRLVDGEKRPAMGYIYEAMDRAKEAIEKSFDKNEDKYKDIFSIIDKRWECQLHQPLHAAGHFLNPQFFYKYHTIEHDEEVTCGLYKCVEKLLSENDQVKAMDELSLYTKAEGQFGINLAIKSRDTKSPDQSGNYPPFLASSNKGISGGAIAGIIIAVIILLLGVGTYLYFGVYKKRKAKKSQLIPSSLDENSILRSNAATDIELSSEERNASMVRGFTVDKSVEFSYEELAKATNDFSMTHKIGEGGFGAVYYAELRGEKAAIKKMDMEATREFLAELKVLTNVHHLNLVRLIGYCTEFNLFLVYEFIENGNLSQHLRGSDREPLEWSTRVQIALDSARGLEYIHEHTVPVYIHRDIKPANILLNKQFHAKVADFGLTKLTEVGGMTQPTRLVGTFGYMPPEYAQFGDVSPKIDVYAFGVVLYELISAKEAVVRAGPGTESMGLVAMFEEALNKPDPSEHLKQLVDPRLGNNYPVNSVHKVSLLAKACTHENPQLRPSMRTIVVTLMTLSSNTEDWDVASFYGNQAMVNLMSGR